MTFAPPTWPVFVKGVLFDADGRVLLLGNEQGEWELPGRRLETGSADGGLPGDRSPELALEHELLASTGWLVEVGPLVPGGVWIHEGRYGRRALVVTYGCEVRAADQVPLVSDEPGRLGLFPPREVEGLNMADGYKRSVSVWREGRAGR
ncbi:NUDIX hydrolase [Streptomyces sp. NA04227]|uniref:NUDIX hydrolase n=1 Tax=Streptomyces sp. NA04227 TaxID=2742136 RepID=UPI001592A073|nr:NUDIX hydrolase [Streptomyces sp. NA04227]QKW06177.1 NUDIX hydrolase [Streptomyces sp. NA04227]